MFGTENPPVDGVAGEVGSLFIKTDTAQIFIKPNITNEDWDEVIVSASQSFVGFLSGTTEPTLQNEQHAFWFDTDNGQEWLMARRGGIQRKVELT